MNPQTTELSTLKDVMTLGDVLARSGFFQDARGAAQAVVKVLAGRELGFGPIASMTGVHIVKGKPVMSAMLIAAAIKRSGKYDYKIREFSDKVCKLEFLERVEGKWLSLGESPFSADDAKAAGLGGDNWRHYPRNMLFARAVSNGAKWYTPDIFGGPVYTPDELGIDVDGETGEVKNLTSVTVEEVHAGEPVGGRVSTPVATGQQDRAPAPSSEAGGEPEIPFAYETEEQSALIKRIEAYPKARRMVIMKRLDFEPDGALHKFDVAALSMILTQLEMKREQG